MSILDRVYPLSVMAIVCKPSCSYANANNIDYFIKICYNKTVTIHDASGNAASRPNDTVETVAAELAKLFEKLKKKAVNLTYQYLRDQLEGEEGKTWTWFDGRRQAYVDAVVRYEGDIVLGGGYNRWMELLYKLRLSDIVVMMPGENDTFVRSAAIDIRQLGQGADPGAEYVVAPGTILKAGYDHYGPTPTVGANGGLDWSPSRSHVSATFHEITEIDADLRALVDQLRSYAAA